MSRVLTAILTLPLREDADDVLAPAVLEAGNLLMERVGDFERTLVDQPLTWRVEVTT